MDPNSFDVIMDVVTKLTHSNKYEWFMVIMFIISDGLTQTDLAESISVVWIYSYWYE